MTTYQVPTMEDLDLDGAWRLYHQLDRDMARLAGARTVAGEDAFNDARDQFIAVARRIRALGDLRVNPYPPLSYPLVGEDE